ncbi:MAG TPA: hypothetical protein VL201_00295 [Patescibacteria group bacterium]|nr:hypothetical protein [Patescibacteria group bacterium]
MKVNRLLYGYVWLCSLIGYVIASEQRYINVSGSYKKNELICDIFKIGGSCKVNTVKAQKGSVCGSMKVKEGLIQDQLNVDGSLRVSGLLHVSEYNIGGSLKAKKIETIQANVGGSMTTNYIFCKEHLNVGGSLKTDVLKCNIFEVGGSTNAHEIYAREGTANGSMNIKQKAYFTTKLFVGGLLDCNNTQSDGETKVGLIKAKNSIFKDIVIQSLANRSYVSGNSVVYNGFSILAFFYSLWQCVERFFFGISQNTILAENERSEFANCTIESLLIEKNNNKKQIIELKNTSVLGEIVFAHGTQGEVWMDNNSQVRDIKNGTCVRK